MLAERVLKTMVVSKLSVLFSAAALLCTAVTALALSVPQDLDRAAVASGAPGDLRGRLVEESGAAAAGGDVWAIGGRFDRRVALAHAKTDSSGHFVFSGILKLDAVKEAMAAGQFDFYARGRDGRLGWLRRVERRDSNENKNDLTIAIGPVLEVRGRLLDSSGQPIPNAAITPQFICRPGESRVADSFALTPQEAASNQTVSSSDGTFVLKNIPQGACLQAAVAAPERGWAHFFWDTARPVTLRFHDGSGRIAGQIQPPGALALARGISVSASLVEPPDAPAPGSFLTLYHGSARVAADGSFRIDALPPGKYNLEVQLGDGVPFAVPPLDPVDTTSDDAAKLTVRIERLCSVTGRVLDARTGAGVASVPVHCYRFDGETFVKDPRTARTDAGGRYSLCIAPGTIKVLPDELPQRHLVPRHADVAILDLTDDHEWPDLKLIEEAELKGVVLDQRGQPVPGAHVYLFEPNRDRPHRSDDRVLTGPDGSFQFGHVDPDETLALSARTNISSTPGMITVRPGDIRDAVTLTVDPAVTCLVRGMAVDEEGRRIRGARVNLWWGRPRKQPGPGCDNVDATILESYVTNDNGWFVFRGLWRGYKYSTETEASGHEKVLTHLIVDATEATHDVGKIVLPADPAPARAQPAQ